MGRDEDVTRGGFEKVRHGYCCELNFEARPFRILNAFLPVIGVATGMGDCSNQNFIVPQKIGNVERKSGQVNSSKSAVAFPPKQRLSHDGLSNSLDFLAKTHSKAKLDFLIIPGRLLGFLKCLGNKLQKINHLRGAIFASLANASAAGIVFERP